MMRSWERCLIEGWYFCGSSTGSELQKDGLRMQIPHCRNYNVANIFVPPTLCEEEFPPDDARMMS